MVVKNSLILLTGGFMDKASNYLAVSNYLSLKGLLNERKQYLKTNVQAFFNGISVYNDETEIWFSHSKCNDIVLSFENIEYSKLWEILGKHISVNVCFQCFEFKGEKLVVRFPENDAIKVVIS